jgi:ABC-type glutathione transport system ATPase component
VKESAPSPWVLEAKGVSICFGDRKNPFHAVKSLDLTVAPGETVAIVGESGSGKSVTSLTIMRLVEFGGGRVSSGSIRFRSRTGKEIDLLQASEEAMEEVRGGEIAMIFQEPMTSLNPVETVGDQIIEAIQLHEHCGAAEARRQAIRILDQVRIPDSTAMLKRYPHELSGGMRQRVMIAMAISCKPSLLIADEPTTALDVTIQAQILQLIRELQRELGMGVIFVTHDMGVVAEIADRVLVMRRGEVVEQNTVAGLFKAPQHHYTKALMAAVPRLGSMRGTDGPAFFDLLQTDEDLPAPSKAATTNSKSPANGKSASNTATDSPILSVRDLVTRFDVRSGIFSRVVKRVHAVEHVSFDLRAGETLALVGESGCGKTTTGRSLLGLAKSTGGTVRLAGRDISWSDRSSLRFLRRQMQFVFQDPFASLNPRMRVIDSIKEPILIHGIATEAEAQKRAEWLLERVGLDIAAGRRWPHEFSGGQRQRICIARALSVNPKIVVADEAVSALDVSIQAQIVNLMLELQQELGVSYIFISHDMAVVERVSHRVAVMYLGQIVEIGPRRMIFEDPRHPYTRRLLAAVPIADPSARREVELDPSEIPSPIRPLGYDPSIRPLVEVAPEHFVAQHQIGRFDGTS